MHAHVTWWTSAGVVACGTAQQYSAQCVCKKNSIAQCERSSHLYCLINPTSDFSQPMLWHLLCPW